MIPTGDPLDPTHERHIEDLAKTGKREEQKPMPPPTPARLPDDAPTPHLPPNDPPLYG